jgi:putative glutamine amidotransferase
MKTKYSIILSLMIMTSICSCSKQAAPLIGISCGRTSTGAASLSTNYTDAIAKAGGIPVVLPIVDDPALAEGILAKLDGVVFSGGPDLDPAEYGEEILNETVSIDAVRDRSDLLLARAALASGKPVLAICRGEQLMNVVLGGTLYQDLPTQVEGVLPHRDTTHMIGVEKGSVLYDLFGSDSLLVNTFHHQAVKDVAPGSRVTAYSPDGIVEAYENDNVLAVQFHPERMFQADPSWLKLFRYLVDKAK